MRTQPPGAMRGRTASLTDAEIDLYARQIIVPGVGAAGQLRLLSSPVYFPGQSADARLGRRYAAAAGMPVVHEAQAATLAIVSLCQTEPLDAIARMIESRTDSTAASHLSQMPIVLYGAEHPPRPRIVCGAEQLHAVRRNGTMPISTRPSAHLNAAACAAVGTAMALILGWQAAKGLGADDPRPVSPVRPAPSNG